MTSKGLQFDENVEIRNFIEDGGSQVPFFGGATEDSNYSAVSSGKKNGGGGGKGFIQELDNLQTQQATITKRCEKEKKKEIKLLKNVEILQREVLELQAATNNGARVVEDERQSQKTIHRLEHRIQKLKEKLSLTRTNNNKFIKAINELRKDKNLNLEILRGLDNDEKKMKATLVYYNTEIVSYNERKHQAKLELTKSKSKMIVDMEDFKNEMTEAKKVMNENQDALMAGIRDKMDLAMYAASLASPPKQLQQDKV